MDNTPYGYVISNGKAIVDEKAAKQVKELFRVYLMGISLIEAGKVTCISKPHSSIVRILINKRYLGDGFYPMIIDEDTFLRAEEERLKRAKMLGRIRKPEEKNEAVPDIMFSMPVIRQLHENPFEQAEYAYSQIKCEVEYNAE